MSASDLVPGRVHAAIGAWPWVRLARFAGGGLLNTAFGYLAFTLSLRLGLAVPFALVASTICGIVFNFQTSRRLVFQSKETGLLFRFALVYLVLVAVNYVAIAALQSCGLRPGTGQAVLVLPMALAAFFAQHHLVFQARRPLP